MTMTKKDTINKIFYEILSWQNDEGDYQPTQIEAEQEVSKALNSYAAEVLRSVMPTPKINLGKNLDGTILTDIENGEIIGWDKCLFQIKSKAAKLGLEI